MFGMLFGVKHSPLWKGLSVLTIRLIVTAASLVLGSGLIAEDWPQFLGPNRDGISTEQNLISEFPTDGPTILWRTEFGVGMSGIAVVDRLAYTMYQDDERQYVVAVDAESGEQRWRTQLGDAFTNSMGNGPRATPAVYSDSVFVFTAEGTVASLDAESGHVRWKANTLQKVESKPADYGMSSSPLVTGGKVIVHLGAPDAAVIAYDIKTGEQVWGAGNQNSGYSSAVLRKPGGVEQVISFCAKSVQGIAPGDGEVLWEYPFVTDYDCNIACPILLDDSTLLISAGENQGSVALQVTQEGDAWTVTEQWSSLGRGSSLRSEWQTPVLHDNYLFGLDNLGSAGPITNLVCVDAASGKQRWLEKRFGKSNLTLADGKLFISTMKGELVIATASADGYQETARAPVLGMTRQAPAIANGRLYLRDDKEMVCIDVKAK